MPLSFCKDGGLEGVSGCQGKGWAVEGAGHLEPEGVMGKQVTGSSWSLGPTSTLLKCDPSKSLQKEDRGSHILS